MVENDDNNKIMDVIEQILVYCKNENWVGYDPFDGLNSRIWFLKANRLLRHLWIQLHKRSPLNFRIIASIPKGRNPKGIGLFVSGLLNLYKKYSDDKYLSLAMKLLEWLGNKQIDGGWGYNFGWQSRSFFVPQNTPNMIATVFVANAFLDAFEVTKDERYLRKGLFAGIFILKKLNIYKEGNDICFSYTPLDNSKIHNANLLAAALLARLYKYSKELNFLENSQKAISFSIKYQNDDGSWYYGLDNNQRWIDSFHTGYNLVALKKFMDYTNDYSYEKSLHKGYRYYKENLFNNEGIPKYYNKSLYPIDIHSISQAIITLCEFDEIETAHKIIDWTIKYMWNEKGYFYYQRYRFFTNKIPYMRWSQAWMFYAITEYISKVH